MLEKRSLLAAAAVLLGACSVDQIVSLPVSPDGVSASLSAGGSPGAPQPTLVRVCAAPPRGESNDGHDGEGAGNSASGLAHSPTFTTVADAIRAVATGGTVLICEGTHTVQNVRIRRAVTIRGQGRSKPVLDAQGARTNFSIRDVVGGPVVLSGLEFRGTWMKSEQSPQPGGFGANINIEGSYSTIEVEESTFFPSGQAVAYVMPGPGQPRLSHNSGIWMWHAIGNGVSIRNNTFTGGDIGIGGQGLQTIVTSNAFRLQSNAAVHMGRGGGTVTVQNNVISDCGTAWCVHAFSPEHATLNVVANQITVASPRSTHRAIAADVRDVTIAGNVITGIGGARTDSTTYPIVLGIGAHASQTEARSDYKIAGNTITGVYSAINLASVTVFGTRGPVYAEASDNRISGVAMPFSGSGGDGLVSVKMSRNDFTQYSLGTDVHRQGRSFASVDLVCNWWGQASGPSGYFPPQWQTAVNPVATQPIAGRPEVSCG